MTTTQILRRLLAVAVLATLPLGGVAAQTPAEVTLSLEGNRKVTGAIGQIAGGQLQLTRAGTRLDVPLDQLTVSSLARVADACVAGIGEAGAALALADVCLSKGLWARARTAYRKAIALDASYVNKTLAEQGLAQADQLESRALYQAGVDAQGAGKPARARTAFEALLKRFPASRYAAPARKLMALLPPPKVAKQPPVKQPPVKKPPRVKQPPVKPKPKPKPTPAATNPYVRYLKQLKAEVEAHRKEGLRLDGASKQSRAIKQFKAALDKLTRIAQLAEKLAHHKDPAVAEAAQAEVADMGAQRIKFWLHLGHVYAQTDQLREATFYVNQVLVVEPENKQALGLREKITEERMRRVVTTRRNN